MSFLEENLDTDLEKGHVIVGAEIWSQGLPGTPRSWERREGASRGAWPYLAGILGFWLWNRRGFISAVWPTWFVVICYGSPGALRFPGTEKWTSDTDRWHGPEVPAGTAHGGPVLRGAGTSKGSNVGANHHV